MGILIPIYIPVYDLIQKQFFQAERGIGAVGDIN